MTSNSQKMELGGLLAKVFATFYLPGKSKKLIRLVGCGIKSMRLISQTEMLIYQSKANLDEKVLFGKITHLQDPKIRNMFARSLFGN